MTFRYDINVLRAIAVISVVIFHFNEAILPGGFVGVDVFFVISGFLMTKIICDGLGNHNFNVLTFYISRVNRIFPPLLLLCSVLFFWGWFYLIPLDFRALGKHIFSSVLFISNFVYWGESGYFDLSSYTKWLLHTWSLSVEWQFYLLYPLLLIKLWTSTTKKNFKNIILLFSLFSFFLSLYISNYYPDASYYLLPSRMWEMLVGAIAFLFPFNLSKNNKSILFYIGLLLIISSFFLMSKDDMWPGYLAIIPVLGAYLIIVSNCNQSFLLKNRVFQSVGLWSYSIYLWHWPLVVSSHYYSVEFNWFYGLLISIFLGFLSFVIIERRSYRKVFLVREIWKVKSLYLSMIIALIGLLGYLTNGYSFHYNPQLFAMSMEAKNQHNSYSYCNVKSDITSCISGDKSKPVSAIVIGDSHAQGMVEVITNAAKPKGSVLNLTAAGCIVRKNTSKLINGVWSDFCSEFIDNSITAINEKYPGIPVFIISRTSSHINGPNEPDLVEYIHKETYRIPNVSFDDRSDNWKQSMTDGLYETACSISEYHPVYMIRDIPEMKLNVPLTMSKQLLLSGSINRVKVSKDEYNSRLELSDKMMQRVVTDCNAKVLDFSEVICDDLYCYGDVDGRPIYFDDDHLSLYGASLFLPKFKKALDEGIHQKSFSD